MVGCGSGLRGFLHSHAHMCLKNIELNLRIRNIVFDFNSYYEVCLTQNNHMIIDKDDLDFTRKYIIHSSIGNNHQSARVASGQYFHNVLLNFNPQLSIYTIEHINGNPLENQKTIEISNTFNSNEK